MSDKLKKKLAKALDRPFFLKILRRAEQIALDYQVILRYEDGEYFGRGLELPLAMGEGRTPGECLATTRKSMTLGVAVLLEQKKIPPRSASDR